MAFGKQQNYIRYSFLSVWIISYKKPEDPGIFRFCTHMFQVRNTKQMGF